MVFSILKGILYVLITVYAIGIVARVIEVLNIKIDEIQANTKLAKNGKLNSYVDIAQGVVEVAVLSVMQVYVDELKKNGEFTKEAHYEAKNKAIEIANTLITNDVRNAIKTLYGDVDVYIENLIEKYVLELK